MFPKIILYSFHFLLHYPYITPIYTIVVSIFFSITPMQPLSQNYGPLLRPGYLYRGQDAQQILAEEKASSWDHVMFCVELLTLHLMYSLAFALMIYFNLVTL